MNKMTLLKAFNDINDEFIEDAAPSNIDSNIVSFDRKQIKRYFKAIAGMAAAIVLVVSIGIINNINNHSQDVTVVNPYIYCDSIDEAESIVGFDVDAPKSMLNKELEYIVVISGDTIELDYGNDDKSISLRKAPGSDDISGDSNSYSIEKTYLLGKIEITIKGNDKINLIMWTDSGYSYAIGIPEGVEESQIEEIVKKIK